MSVHTNVVPDYPYNVHQPVHPSHGAAAMAPDDNEISTNLPKICVDYLSHNWTEEDIWASWKTMTKTKAERTNGMRLENASWRTWAKQRNRLKTISPETLNWLKDSDVTWLYGPLHTADEEPAIEIQQLQRDHESEKAQKEDEAEKSRAAAENRSIKESSRSSNNDASAQKPSVEPGTAQVARNDKPQAKGVKNQSSSLDQKSILKRRSLTDILLSPEMVELLRDGRGKDDDFNDTRILRTASDSNLTGLGSHSFGPFPNATASSTASSSSASLEPDFKDREPKSNNKHISFNRNVEQYIAVDSDQAPHAYIDASDSSDSEAFSPSSYSYLDHKESGSFDNSYDSDDDILTFGSRPRLPFIQNTPKKHKLIAPLNNTSLKTVDLTQWPNSSQDFHAPVVAAPSKGNRYVNGEANKLLQPSDSDHSDNESDGDSSSNAVSLENLNIDEIPSPEASTGNSPSLPAVSSASSVNSSSSESVPSASVRSPTVERSPAVEHGRGRSAHRANTSSDRTHVHHRANSRSRSSESVGLSSESNSGGESSVSTSDSSNSSDASDTSASNESSSSSDSSPSNGPPEPRVPSATKVSGENNSTSDPSASGTTTDQKSTHTSHHVDNAASDDAPDSVIGRTAGNVWSWSKALWN